MITDLKKQLQEQLEALKVELKNELSVAFEGYDLDITITDGIDGIVVNAIQTTKVEAGRMKENTIVFKYDRPQNINQLTSASRIVITDRYNQLVAVQIGGVTISYEFIGFVFSTLATFINDKNPILDSRE